MNTALLLLLFCTGAQALFTKCLDNCLCDRNQQSIYCHNINRTTLLLPDAPLPDFRKINLSFNRITQLPAETDILIKFPDIETIIMTGNALFNCSQLLQFREINIVADCEPPQLRWNNTENCDQLCKRRRELPQCFKDCECDQKNAVLHCRDRRSKKLILPLTPLPGYKTLFLSKNRVEDLPSENELKVAFPDIQLIVITSSPVLECDVLREYKDIGIYGNCYNDTLSHTESSPQEKINEKKSEKIERKIVKLRKFNVRGNNEITPEMHEVLSSFMAHFRYHDITPFW